MKVEEAYRVFMTHGAAERLYAKETLAKHDDVFRSWLLPIYRGKEVENIRRSDVLTLRAQLVARGRSVYRQYSVLMTLKLFLKFCRNIMDMPCLDPAQIELPNRKRPKVITLSNNEVGRMREACAIHTQAGLRTRTLLEVLLGTGLRIGEALALDREPFDAGAHELEIRSKGGRHRIIFFNEESLTWIRRYLNTRVDSQAPLFVTTTTPVRRLSRADVSEMFLRLKQKANVNKRASPQILRHTYCTNLLNNGADIMHIKELAGHSDIQVTARYYLGVDRDALRRVVKRLNYTN